MKTFLITGATGGIGKELSNDLLKESHRVFMIVRNFEKAKDIFGQFPNAHIQVCNIEDYDEVTNFLLNKAKENITFDTVLLLAGDLRKDSDPMFAGDNQEQKEQNSIIYHELVSVRTAETIIFGLQKAFGEKLKDTVLLGVSSWAAHFPEGHPYRKDEEGYVRSKAKLSNILKELQSQNVFKDVICEEPSLIVTPLTQREFPELLADANVSRLTSSEYAEHLKSLFDL